MREVLKIGVGHQLEQEEGIIMIKELKLCLKSNCLWINLLIFLACGGNSKVPSMNTNENTVSCYMSNFSNQSSLLLQKNDIPHLLESAKDSIGPPQDLKIYFQLQFFCQDSIVHLIECDKNCTYIFFLNRIDKSSREYTVTEDFRESFLRALKSANKTKSFDLVVPQPSLIGEIKKTIFLNGGFMAAAKTHNGLTENKYFFLVLPDVERLFKNVQQRLQKMGVVIKPIDCAEKDGVK
jgi:hypothetical protein